MRFLETCLSSLDQQDNKDFEVIVVDNGSTDESVSFVRTHYPKCRLIEESDNLGWGTAVNHGIQKAAGEYVVLLNNDVELKADFVSSLIKASKENPTYSMFGVKILAFDDRQLIDSLGEVLGKTWNTTKRLHHVADHPSFDKELDIFGPSATAAMYKKSLFDDVGFFDPDFFIGYDDPDLHFRAQLAGHRCRLIPSAVVYHIGHGTADFTSKKMKYLMTRNSFYFTVKNIPAIFFLTQPWDLIGFHLLWSIKDTIKIMLGSRQEDLLIRMRARADALLFLGALLKKRKIIQRNRRVSLKYVSLLRTNG